MRGASPTRGGAQTPNIGVPHVAITTAGNRTPSQPVARDRWRRGGQVERSSWASVLGIVAGLGAALAAVLTLFVWPAGNSSAHDLPLAVFAPGSSGGEVERRLDDALPGVYDVRAYSSADAAREAVRDRDAYGAVVAGDSGLEVVVSSGSSPAVAQLISQLAPVLADQAPPGGSAGTEPASVPVVDVAPPTAEDPRGSGLSAAMLPLSLGGTVAANVLILLVHGRSRRLAGAAASALLGGVVAAAVLHSWLGVLPGSFAAIAVSIALALTAMTFALVGLEALFGKGGVAAGIGLVVLAGTPLSGQSSAPDMLPGRWGDVGQLLPPGATGSLLRSSGFFAGSGATGPVLVLLCWAVVGLGLHSLAAYRRP